MSANGPRMVSDHLCSGCAAASHGACGGRRVSLFAEVDYALSQIADRSLGAAVRPVLENEIHDKKPWEEFLMTSLCTESQVLLPRPLPDTAVHDVGATAGRVGDVLARRHLAAPLITQTAALAGVASPCEPGSNG